MSYTEQLIVLLIEITVFCAALALGAWVADSFFDR